MDKDISQAIQIWGGQREEALRVFARQMEQWGLVMPKVEPLVCDFGLGKFSEVGLIEY